MAVTPDGRVLWTLETPFDSPSSKKAEDALAGPFDELLDVFLAGRGRGVKHAAFAVAVGAVDTIEEKGVKVRRKSQVAVGSLDGGHRAGFARGQAAQGVALAIPLGHRVRENAQDLAQQFSGILRSVSATHRFAPCRSPRDRAAGSPCRASRQIEGFSDVEKTPFDSLRLPLSFGSWTLANPFTIVAGRPAGVVVAFS